MVKAIRNDIQIGLLNNHRLLMMFLLMRRIIKVLEADNWEYAFSSISSFCCYFNVFSLASYNLVSMTHLDNDNRLFLSVVIVNSAVN